ncbi:MAG TPA: amidohydrolase family protein, partial [Bacteroidota bacterium]|nr:amidohydrolase family protein [Bacteroidota bacterium]
MLRRSALMLFIVVLSGGKMLSQVSPHIGLRDNTPAVFAFVHARIVQSAGSILPRGTLVIRDGIIQEVGEAVHPPADATVIDLEGKTIYPGFIDLSSDYGTVKPAPQGAQGTFGINTPTVTPSKGPAHWNPKVTADIDAGSQFVPDTKDAEKMRSQGFTVVLSTPQIGIFRGSSALVNLGAGTAGELVMKRQVAQTVSFETSGGFGGGYPNSLMGVIALIRQTWLDADWYRRARDAYAKNSDQKAPELNSSLAALEEAVQGKQPVVTEISDDLNFVRAAKIAREFSLKVWVRGSGYEYRRLDDVKATKLPVIVPLNFPDAPAVESPEEAMNVSLQDLEYWDAAPENPGRLEKAGVPFVLTSATLKDVGTFLSQLRKAVERGLSEKAALAALTSTPAAWLGLEKELGSLERGKIANFVVTDGDLFSEKTKITTVWISGKQYDVKTIPVTEPRGVWTLRISVPSDSTGSLSLTGEPEKLSGNIRWGGKFVRLASASFSVDRIALTFAGDSVGQKGTVRLSGNVGRDDIIGVGDLPGGDSFTWSATRTGPPRSEPDTSKPPKAQMSSFVETL